MHTKRNENEKKDEAKNQRNVEFQCFSYISQCVP